MRTKPWILFTRLRSLLAALTWVVTIPAFLFSFWMPAIQRIAAWLAVTLAPLPRKPTWRVDRFSDGGSWLPITLLAGILLGAVTSIRILGPLAGLLVVLYYLPGTSPAPGLDCWSTAASPCW